MALNVTPSSVIATGKNMKQNFHVCDHYTTDVELDIVGITTTCINLVFAIPAILGNLLVLFNGFTFKGSSL